MRPGDACRTLPAETRREGNRRPPIGLPGESRAVLRRRRRRPHRARRRRRTGPARRGAGRGDRGAAPPEGARRLRDQRGAAAGQEGRDEPRERSASCSPPGSARSTASAPSTWPARASSTSPSRPARRARSPRTSSPPGRRTGTPRCSPGSRSTSSSSRPTRPGPCTSVTPAGPCSVTRSRAVLAAAGAEVTREFYINDRGVQMDHFADSIVAAALGRADAGGRVRRRIHRRPRQGRSRPPAPASSTCPPTSGASPCGPRATRSSSGSSSRQLERFHTHFDVWFSEESLHASGSVPETLRAPQGARPRLRAGRRAVDAHHRLRRRQGPGADQVRRHPDLLRLGHRLLPRQARRAASTTASTCSVPTTTATSAGSGPWPPAWATTRTRPST